MASKPFVCKLCSAGFNRFTVYKKHVEQSHVSSPVDNRIKEVGAKNVRESSTVSSGDLQDKLVCEYCSREFSTKSNLNRHVKYSCRVAGDKILESLPVATASSLLTTLLSTAKTLSGGNGRVVDNRMINRTSNTNTNNGILNTNNGTINNDNRVLNQHIHINPLGKESLDHITKEHKIEILKQGIGAVAALVNAIMTVPENRNIAISDKRNCKVMFVNRDGKVEIGALAKVIALYTTYNIDRIDEFLDAYHDELPLTDKTIQRLMECIGNTLDDDEKQSYAHVDTTLFENYHEKCMDQIQDILTVNKKTNMSHLNKYLDQIT
jgi:hypothetical protein